MNNKKTTKSALLLSCLSLLLCVSMLVGSTFAWFTDSATTGVNTIVAGNLDIKLSYKNAKTGASFAEVSTSTTDLFVNKDGGAVLWEPGAASVCYFKLENLGTLALDYNLAVLANDTVLYNGRGLSGALKTAVVPMANENATLTNAEAIAAATAEGAQSVLTYVKSETMAANATDCFAMVVYMPTSVNNDYNVPAGQPALQTELQISLFATQATVENDSFGNQYDKDAGAVDLTTLQGEQAKSLSGRLILGKLNADLTTANSDIQIGDANLKQSGVTEIIFNGGTINTPYDGATIQAGINNSTSPHADNETNGSRIQLDVPAGTKLVFNNLTINGYYNFNAYQHSSDVKLEFVNCTFNGCWIGQTNGLQSITFKGCTFTLDGMNTTTVKDTNPLWLYSLPGQTLTLENCTIEGNRPVKYGERGAGATLNVTGCTFTLAASEYDIANNRPDRVTAVRFDGNVTANITGNTMVSGYAFYQTSNAPYSAPDYDDAGNNNVKPADANWVEAY